MPSNRITLIVIAVIGLLVVTAAAANVTSPATGGSGIEFPADWTGSSEDDADDRFSNGDVMPDGSQLEFPIGALCFPILFTTEVQLLLISIVLFTGLLLWRLRDRFTAAVVLATTVPMGTVIYLALAASCQIEPSADAQFGLSPAPVIEAANNSTGGAIEVANEPVVYLLLLAAIGLLVIGLVLLRDDLPDRDIDELEEVDEDPEADRIALAQIAGDTARRLAERDSGDAALENEIYRAWVAMTEHLEVTDPDTTTPGEFAAAAVAIGLHAEDVQALTELFEAVRYGDRPVTTAREQAAIEFLDRLEQTYGDEE